MSQVEGNVSIEDIDKDNAERSVEDTEPDNNYLKLRRLVLGEDYSSALKRYISKEEEVERVADVLPQAVKLSTQTELGNALAPVVDKAIERSIEQNPTRITHILFPIMGPAIRKAVASALAEMVQSLNILLEKSLTLGSLNWRIRAWRAGMPYAQYVLLQTIQYRVEQVLLVHRETGLLLNSVTAPEVHSQDPELVSSMLTAIGDFVSDSFSSGDETLEKIRFGDLEIHLNVGPHAILAIAVRGSASDELALKAKTTIEAVHAHFGHQLNHFGGDREPFDASTPILSECLLTQKHEIDEKRKPWMAIALLICGGVYGVFSGIKSVQLEQQYIALEKRISDEPDYTVISAESKGETLYIKALRSPESRSTELVSDELLTYSESLGRDGWLPSGGIVTVIDDTVVHMGEMPSVVVQPVEETPKKPDVDIEKVTKALLVDGEQVTIIAQGANLSVKGEVSEATRQRLMENETLKQTYDDIDLSGLVVNDRASELDQFKALVDRIHNTVFYFEPNESRLSGDELLKVPHVVKTIAMIERQASVIGVSDLQLLVMGFADSSGSSFANTTVSQQRADVIRSILTKNAVSADIVVAWGAGNIDLDNISEKAQRRVTLQLLYSRDASNPERLPSFEQVPKTELMPDSDPVPHSEPLVEEVNDMDVNPGDS